MDSACLPVLLGPANDEGLKAAPRPSQAPGRSSPGQSVSRVSPGPAGDTACSLLRGPLLSLTSSRRGPSLSRVLLLPLRIVTRPSGSSRSLSGSPPSPPTPLRFLWNFPFGGNVISRAVDMLFTRNREWLAIVSTARTISATCMVSPTLLLFEGGNELSSRPQRLDKQMKSYGRRWETQYNALVRRGWWAGAHQFTSSGPDAWRAYKRKGTTCWRPLHKCVACNREVPRAEIPVSPCPQAARALVPAKARKVWQACAKESKDAVAKDRRKRNKGLSRKEVCRRARAGRWGHDIGNIAPNGKQSAARS